MYIYSLSGNRQLTAKGHSWICRLCDQIERRTKLEDYWLTSGVDVVDDDAGFCSSSNDAHKIPKRCRPNWRMSLRLVHCLLPSATWHLWRRAEDARKMYSARQHLHFHQQELRHHLLRCFRCRRRQRPTSQQQSSCGSEWHSRTKTRVASEKTENVKVI